MGQGVGERPCPEPSALRNSGLAMPLALYLLPAALAVQASRPSARVVVTARNDVDPSWVARHVEEAKAAAMVMMGPGGRDDRVDVEIKRVVSVDTEDALSTDVIMSSVIGAYTVS